MGTTLAVIVLIAIVLAVGLLRDSMRTKAVEHWSRTHGFMRVLPPDHDRERLIAWAKIFHPASASHWGIVLRGNTAGFEMSIAEHEDKGKSSAAGWHALAVTRVPGLQLDAVRITHAGSQVVRSVTAAAIAPGDVLREQLGIEVTRAVVHPVGQGKWGVEVVNDGALAFWSSQAQAAAIDAWRHDAELAAVDDIVLVRVPGVISASTLDDLLAAADAARAFFTQAAAARRMSPGT